MVELMINIDVEDLPAALEFYTTALGLTLNRRLGPDMVELAGATSPIYVLEKPPGPGAVPRSDVARDYARHWTPVHLDVSVLELEPAVARAEAAGARLELPISEHEWGRMALMADPFGHGFCLIEFSDRGYDVLLDED